MIILRFYISVIGDEVNNVRLSKEISNFLKLNLSKNSKIQKIEKIEDGPFSFYAKIHTKGDTKENIEVSLDESHRIYDKDGYIF